MAPNILLLADSFKTIDEHYQLRRNDFNVGPVEDEENDGEEGAYGDALDEADMREARAEFDNIMD